MASFRIQALSVTPDQATSFKQVDLNFNWRDVMGAPIDIFLFANNGTNHVIGATISGLIDSLGFDGGRAHLKHGSRLDSAKASCINGLGCRQGCSERDPSNRWISQRSSL